MKDIKVIPISAYTKSNLDELLYQIMDTLEQIPQNAFLEEAAPLRKLSSINLLSQKKSLLLPRR